MQAAGIKYDTYTEVVVEPTDKSFQHLIDYARAGNFDSFVAVGGGSVLDSAKAANLYLCNPEAELLDFVNAPIGKGASPGLAEAQACELPACCDRMLIARWWCHARVRDLRAQVCLYPAH